MNQLTQEWVDKAEYDFASARRELRARKDPNYDAACFHAQECAAKYIKAKLQEENIYFSAARNLESLLTLILPIEPQWLGLQADFRVLQPYKIDIRYPGMKADKPIAKQAVQLCTKVRSVVRSSLGLPS
jgi:HEPN domain-containing protein